MKDNLACFTRRDGKEQICQPVSEADGYSFTTMNGGLLAFNNSTILVVNVSGTTQTEKAKEAITNLLKQTTDNSIREIRSFPKNGESRKAISTSLLPWTAIPSTYPQPDNHGITY